MLSGDVGDEKWWSYFQHEDTPISRVFMGQLRSTLICDTCKEASTTFDPFWDLALPIPKVCASQSYLKKLTYSHWLPSDNDHASCRDKFTLYCT